MNNGKILIIDSGSFSRVCSAILGADGFVTSDQSGTIAEEDDEGKVALVIVSYPYGESFFDRIKKHSVPTIVLTDQISSDLITKLEGVPKWYCMVNPIDYRTFRNTVRHYMSEYYPPPNMAEGIKMSPATRKSDERGQ